MMSARMALVLLLHVGEVHALKQTAALRGGQPIASASPAWSKEAFNNVRVPAALLSGSSFVAVNTAPLPVKTDGIVIGMIKRIYLIVGVGSFASTLLSVLIATIALERLGNTAAYDDDELELEYVACQTHFFMGVLCACLLVGLRAWVAFTCPVFGRVAAMIIASSFFLMLHFLPSQLSRIPVRYLQLLLDRISFTSPLLLLSLGTGIYSFGLLADGLYKGFSLDPSRPAWLLRKFAVVAN